jgi:membrane protease subunit HflC
VLAIGLATAGAYLSFFVVHQNEQALVLEFGDPKRVINKHEVDATGQLKNAAGLYWKLPLVQTVEYFDKRILDLDTQPQEITAADQKRLVVDAFARYRNARSITDRLLYAATVASAPISLFGTLVRTT